MKIVFIVLALLGLGYGIWFVTNNQKDVKSKVASMLDLGHFHTLEIRYTANQVMEKYRPELLKDNRHRFLDPILEFYPYLLMEVKYTSRDNKSYESIMLWDLTDGEMVLNTKDWEMTHGFSDCITAETNSQEFKILNLLARKGGRLDRQKISKSLKLDEESLNRWIDSCCKKKLIVQAGNYYQLHFQNPRLHSIPETLIDEKLVTKAFKDANHLGRHFTPSQIEKITKAAFGQNFAIRKMTDVYLPVHSIMVQNPDGSIHTSHWNALNGKRLSRSNFID